MIRIEHDYVYSANVDDVFDVIVSPDLYDEVAVRSRALDYTSSVTHVHEVHTISLERHLPTDEVPSFAKSLIGDTLRVQETTWWKAGTPDDGQAPGYHATFDVRIMGTPVTLNGTMRLTPAEDGHCRHHIVGDLKAAVPLLGGRIEQSVREPVDLQIATVSAIVTERLSAASSSDE